MTDPSGAREERPHYGAIGCLLGVVGVFAGGMLGVAVGWIVTKARGCTPPEGFPICDIYRYWLPGMLFGALTLPAMAIWRLRRGGAGPESNRRG
jgi:hypothetical protein